MMSESSVVRTAQPEDENGIVELCRMMHAETGMTEFNEAQTMSVLHRAWSHDGVMIGVIGPIGAPVACSCLGLIGFWNSKSKILSDLATFVHPDHRRSRHARNLLEFAKQAADALGLPVSMTVAGGQANDKRLKLYQREFGGPTGAHFVYTPKVAEQTQAEVAV